MTASRHYFENVKPPRLPPRPGGGEGGTAAFKEPGICRPPSIINFKSSGRNAGRPLRRSATRALRRSESELTAMLISVDSPRDCATAGAQRGAFNRGQQRRNFHDLDNVRECKFNN